MENNRELEEEKPKSFFEGLDPAYKNAIKIIIADYVIENKELKQENESLKRENARLQSILSRENNDKQKD